MIETIKLVIRFLFLITVLYLYVFGWIKWTKIHIRVRNNIDGFEKAIEGFYGIWLIANAVIGIAFIVCIVIWSFT